MKVLTVLVRPQLRVTSQRRSPLSSVTQKGPDDHDLCIDHGRRPRTVRPSRESTADRVTACPGQPKVAGRSEEDAGSGRPYPRCLGRRARAKHRLDSRAPAANRTCTYCCTATRRSCSMAEPCRRTSVIVCVIRNRHETTPANRLSAPSTARRDGVSCFEGEVFRRLKLVDPIPRATVRPPGPRETSAPVRLAPRRLIGLCLIGCFRLDAGASGCPG
jgi:hypothetical protein